jgi:hypothetical protein
MTLESFFLSPQKTCDGHRPLLLIVWRNDMGYRSEIVIALSPETFAGADVKTKQAFEEMFGAPSEETEERIVFHHDYVKWYMEYLEVVQIQAFLQSLEANAFGLFRLGEDPTDTQVEGEPWTWGINHISKLEY